MSYTQTLYMVIKYFWWGRPSVAHTQNTHRFTYICMEMSNITTLRWREPTVPFPTLPSLRQEKLNILWNNLSNPRERQYYSLRTISPIREKDNIILYEQSLQSERKTILFFTNNLSNPRERQYYSLRTISLIREKDNIILYEQSL